MALSMAVLLMLIAPAMGVGSAIGDEVPVAGCGQSNGVAEECSSLVDDATQAAMAVAETSHGRGMLQRSAEAQDHSRLAQAHDENLAEDPSLARRAWDKHILPWLTGVVVDRADSFKVALRTIGGPNAGKYCADEGEKGQVMCNREHIGSWEQFKMVKLRKDREHWGLMGGRYSNHPFWCADEEKKVVCDRGLPQDWENFHMENTEEGKYSIRGGNKHQFCSSKAEGGAMRCREAKMGDEGAEEWEIVVLEDRIAR